MQRVVDILQAEQYYLFRGNIWFLHPLSKCTKVHFASVKQFLGDLCANPDNMAIVFDQVGYLEKLLGDEQCSIVQQLKIDVDTIEVGYMYP